jgi:CheY-like chemotaxis protein
MPPLRVLVVEDSVDNLALMRLQLEDLGYQVITAVTGRAALEAARSQLPNVVISDLHMPEMDGWELLRLIREIPGLASIPAIALTGSSFEPEIQRAHAAGYSIHLIKPVDPEDLFSAIEFLAHAAG